MTQDEKLAEGMEYLGGIVMHMRAFEIELREIGAGFGVEGLGPYQAMVGFIAGELETLRLVDMMTPKEAPETKPRHRG